MKPTAPLLFGIAISLLSASCKTAPPTRFQKADTNGDQKLSRDEMSDYIVDGVFSSLDANHDGKMTMGEWNTAKEAAAEKSFRQRDADKDGIVTLQEARNYAKTQKSYDLTFEEADSNKDHFLSEAEVTAYYASKEGSFR
ncbi:MAG: hypothetical protein EOP86_02345 [Verrucomicrobiaceae bacterium]|nr:MAG: hypothetical protein EOP86_02345 [Verrucomicrobiaceae bacterium]